MTIVVRSQHRIHFTMEGERGAFLILHHGLFGSQRDWYRAGYVEALANDFRLILPDARGHGRSDRPADPGAYAPEAFSADLIAVMNELDIRNAHFVGYSLGALVGFDLVMRHPERARLIMLGGESPLVTPESQALWREAAGRVRAEGLGAWLRAEREAGRLAGEGTPDEALEREPAAALLEALAGWEVPQAETFQAGSPITIFAGTDDAAFERTQSAARRFPRARFIPFAGQTQRGLFESKAAFLDAMLRFIKISRRPEGASEEPAGPGEGHEGGAAELDPSRGRGRPQERGQGGGRGRPNWRGDSRGEPRAQGGDAQSAWEGGENRSAGSPNGVPAGASSPREELPAPPHESGTVPPPAESSLEGQADPVAQAPERDMGARKDESDAQAPGPRDNDRPSGDAGEHDATPPERSGPGES